MVKSSEQMNNSFLARHPADEENERRGRIDTVFFEDGVVSGWPVYLGIDAVVNHFHLFGGGIVKFLNVVFHGARYGDDPIGVE